MAGKEPEAKDSATTTTIPTPMATSLPKPMLSQSLPTRLGNIERNTDIEKEPDDQHRSEASAHSLPPVAGARVGIRQPLDRRQSQIQMVFNGSANFVGWNETEGELRRNWGSKRLRFLAKKYSLNHCRALNEARSIEPAVRYDFFDLPGHSSADTEWNQSQPSGHADQAFSFPYGYGTASSMHDGATPISIARSLSQASDSYVRPRCERRESAARVAYGSAASVAKRGVVDSHRMHRVRLSSRQSFDVDAVECDRGGSPASSEAQQASEPLLRASDSDTSTCLRFAGEDLTHRAASPIIEESASDIFFEQESNEPVTGSRAGVDAVPPQPEHIKMVKMQPSSDDVTKKELPLEKGRSEPSLRPKLSTQEHIDADDLFFAFSADDDRARSKHTLMEDRKGKRPFATVMSLPSVPLSTDTDYAEISEGFPGGISRLDLGDGRLHIPIGPVPLGPVSKEDRHETNQPDRPLLDGVRSISRFMHRYPLMKQTSVMETTKRGVLDGVLRNLGHHSGKLFRPRYRRYRGLGVLSSFYDGSLHREKIDALDPVVRDVIEAGSDERPLFTWWVTSVQVIVCVISLLFYGIGPAGWERVEMKEEVIDVTLVMRQVSYFEPVNLWFGPRFADLIRLGAKYSPCMRREPGLWKLISEERKKENVTGCCVFNDRTGCYQTGQLSCPRTLATWYKWSKQMRPSLHKSKSDSFLFESMRNATLTSRRGTLSQPLPTHSWRTAGAVCGQDPDFCIRPYSVRPYEWPDDLTRWPICEEHRQGAFLPTHMTCQVTGRPCCIQMQGQCRIATREYCSFVKGHFHENATLCSQVNCFSDICGMLPFVRKDHPDQFYRMLFSLFLHAGIVHVAFTVFVQMWLMVDLEMLIGWKRMAILYIGSGIGGNIASAIFVPYSPEVGPSGSHLGIMAALVVDLHHHRHIIVQPRRELAKHMLTVLMLFLTGLLPWVDNWAHLFGFIFGLLITIVTFPYLDFESQEKPKRGCRSTLSRRHIAIVAALISCVILYFLLGYIYFNQIEVNCPWCQYFNCINIKYFTGSNHFCDNTGQKLSQWLPI